jgi:SAM-dependent methyltransferase
MATKCLAPKPLVDYPFPTMRSAFSLFLFPAPLFAALVTGQKSDTCIAAIRAFLSNGHTGDEHRVLEATPNHEIIVIDPHHAVYYEPLETNRAHIFRTPGIRFPRPWLRGSIPKHDARTEIGQGVVTLFSSQSDAPQLFLHSDYGFSQIRSVYPQTAFQFPKNANILDIGCGTGRFVMELQEQRVDATGIDFYIPAPHRKHRFLKMKTLVNSKFPEGHFDRVFATNSFIGGPREVLNNAYLFDETGPGETLGAALFQMDSDWLPSVEDLKEVERILKYNGELYFFPLTQKAYAALSERVYRHTPLLQLMPLDNTFIPLPEVSHLRYGVIKRVHAFVPPFRR